MACCPAHDDRTPSLGVSLGQNAILFHCFAGCSQNEVLSALGRIGINPRDLFSQSGFQREQVGKPGNSPSRNALRLWREGRFIHDTPAKTYLEARSIRASSRELRFHPRTPLGAKSAVRFLPAMIAAVSLDERLIAIHRTFLSETTPEKAKFDNPKRALGELGVGAVRLFPPADGKLGLAEGIESALSARALTGIPVWATLGNKRFGTVAIPDSVTELHLFVDADEGGEIAAERALKVYGREGRTIKVRTPSVPGTDWNDELVSWCAFRKT
ncbi:DUF7146 domain-containing protein [Novosphingopyxis sp.]|uniref:DUF7146 domain-containing protein n=1 Tax=Novosphingopyxis sp. TaxID=2709690 RepID=UPI003B5AC5C4